jgi:hypothetical protein
MAYESTLFFSFSNRALLYSTFLLLQYLLHSKVFVTPAVAPHWVLLQLWYQLPISNPILSELYLLSLSIFACSSLPSLISFNVFFFIY